MTEYRSNSHRSKAESKESAAPDKKDVTKVVTGKVTTKKNEARKITGLFVSEDAANVKSYVILDVLVPAIKKAISGLASDMYFP